MNRFLLPLGIFIVLVGFLAVGLRLNPREIPSPLIDKPAPVFQLAQLHEANKTLAKQDMQGKVWLLNVWASWCVPCHDEAPLLMKMAEDKRYRIVGINQKDNPDNARRFLGRYGNPYAAVGADSNGRASIDWGVYGVPETFVVGKDGRIAYKLVGPITTDNIETTLKPAIAKALGAN